MLLYLESGEKRDYDLELYALNGKDSNEKFKELINVYLSY